MLNLKNKIKIFIVALGCLVSLTVWLYISGVSARAETLYGTQSSRILISGVSGTNLPSGNLNIYSYMDWVNVPFTLERESNSFYYSGDFTSLIPFKIVFPTTWAGRYLTGSVSVRYALSHPMQFFYNEGATFNISAFNDFTERYQLTPTESNFDGMTITVSPQTVGGSDFFFLDIIFNDFYVPIAASSAAYDFGFSLDYHYSFNAQFYSSVTTYNHPEAGRMTAMTSQVQTYSPTQYEVSINGGSVQLSNEYYTIIQALYNSDIDTLLTGIDSYLSSWIGEPSMAITNNWADFSAEVINKLGAIAVSSGADSPLIPAINNIYNLLFLAMQADGYLTTWFSDFYEELSAIRYSNDSIEQSVGSISGNLDTNYPSALGNYLANVYFALTGWNEIIGESGISQSDLDDQMALRWSNIVVEALTEYFGASNISSTDQAEFETQIASVDSGVETQHTIEQSVYEAAQSQFNLYVTGGFFDANTQIMPASVWYVSAINAIHGSLGKLAIPITVAFALGLITAILGRVNRFARVSGSSSDSD